MDRPLPTLRGEPLQITILGAGIAGLAAATLLARTGHRVELLDERFAIPTVGTVLGLFRPAQEVLRRLGVLEAAQELAAAPERGTLRAADGRVLADLPSGGALLLSRSVLVRLLQEALPVEKRTKKGGVKTVDLRPHLAEPVLDGEETAAVLEVTLPCSSALTLNPSLLLTALQAFSGDDTLRCAVVRTCLLGPDGREFC